MRLPSSTPMRTFTSVRLKMVTPVASEYAAMRARAVRTAEPIAKPFPVAAVVLPSESSASVRSRTSGGSPACSAIPPALSATGPYASVAKVMPSVDNIPTAAKATPYVPARSLVSHMAMTTTIPGTTVLNIPSPNPPMMTVAGPVSDCAAISRVNLYSYEVATSDAVPMTCPATRPTRTTQKSSNGKSMIGIRTPIATSTRTPDENMPVRNTQRSRPMFAPSGARMRNVPSMDEMMPTAASSTGSMRSLWSKFSMTSPASMPSAIAPVTANARVAMIEPTYDSNRSAPMPATSPTLSPTLSAIVAGFRGSSSGIPASTFPTRSAPTSAALV